MVDFIQLKIKFLSITYMSVVAKVQHVFTVFEQPYFKRSQYVVWCCGYRECTFQRKFMLLLSQKRKFMYFFFFFFSLAIFFELDLEVKRTIMGASGRTA